ncbi:DinB family protein [Hymenobacter humi]|uniref:DinB family protein n=1 Tax=Hymenobacter humi TaxID=1411620 RepID=A0ABW2U7J2_9BACT
MSQLHPSPAAPPVAQSWLTRYQAVRAQSQALCAPLLPEDTVVQPMLDVSPPKWHLAHTTWFWETFLLKEYAPGYQLFHPDYAFLFNSYYNSLGSRVNRADRGTLSRPPLADVLGYRAHVDAALATLLTENDHLPAAFYEPAGAGPAARAAAPGTAGHRHQIHPKHQSAGPGLRSA